MRRRRLFRQRITMDEIDLALGETVKSVLGHTEVLGQQRLGRMAKPVRNAERAELGEVAVVEDQNEMDRIGAEALDGVCVAARGDTTRPRG
jgi:hypothetical protein